VNGTFGETTIIHGGKQSMPLAYDNTKAPISETVLTFSPAQNWTANGIKSLSLWFQGVASNGGQLYVKINSTKIAYDGDPADLTRASWTVWNLDLSKAGNLSKVTSLTIGVEGTGVKGTLYFDDICLYSKTPEFMLRTAMGHIERGETVMSLAACSYMLRPLVQVLRKEAIPFHNPYRRNNGFWNPIRTGVRGAAANRILALLVASSDFGEGHRPWTQADLGLWGEWLVGKGMLRHGAKKKLMSIDATEYVTMERLDELFEPGALEQLVEACSGDCGTLLRWWRRNLGTEFRARTEFPAAVAAKRGPQALVDKPLVTVGTIHSVKGGEADAVFLYPDISQAGDMQYQTKGAPRDGVIRQFYVGITRARQALYICQPESRQAVTI
jgi:hypothetical protein